MFRSSVRRWQVRSLVIVTVCLTLPSRRLCRSDDTASTVERQRRRRKEKKNRTNKIWISQEMYCIGDDVAAFHCHQPQCDFAKSFCRPGAEAQEHCNECPLLWLDKVWWVRGFSTVWFDCRQTSTTGMRRRTSLGRRSISDFPTFIFSVFSIRSNGNCT